MLFAATITFQGRRQIGNRSGLGGRPESSGALPEDPSRERVLGHQICQKEGEVVFLSVRA